MTFEKKIIDITQVSGNAEQIFDFTGVKFSDGSRIIGGPETTVAGIRADSGDDAPIGSLYLSTTANSNYQKVANNLNNSDWVKIGTGAAGSTGPTGPTGATGPTGPSLVQTAQVILSNAQVLALNGTAIQVVAATGNSTEVIVPISATMAYTRGAASYATNTELDLIHAGSSNALLKTDIGASLSTFATFVDAVSATPSGNVFIANADLNVFVPTGNPTGGDAGSSIIVTVAYVVMSAI